MFQPEASYDESLKVIFLTTNTCVWHWARARSARLTKVPTVESSNNRCVDHDDSDLTWVGWERAGAAGGELHGRRRFLFFFVFVRGWVTRETVVFLEPVGFGREGCGRWGGFRIGRGGADGHFSI